MKVLLINNFHYRKGGSETVYFNTGRLLEAAGHTVIWFSLRDPKNLPCDQAADFATRGGNILAQLRNYFYNRDVARRLEALLEREHPDVAHVHLLWGGVGAAIFEPLRRHGVPLFHTVHDYRMVCPAYTFRDGRGRICEACSEGNYRPCLQNRCAGGSWLRSYLMMKEMQRRQKHYHPLQNIEGFLFVSQFARDKHIEKNPGFAQAYSTVIYNTVPDLLAQLGQSALPPRGDYLLYYGRLSHEKGIETLLDAVLARPEVPLKIVGTGPLEAQLRSRVAAAGASNIEFLGFHSGEDLYRLVAGASFVVVPSAWYENNPMTVIEACALGRPVIGAAIGGIPEIVREGVTGYLFPSGDAQALGRVLDSVLQLDSEAYAALSAAARRLYETHFSEAEHTRALLAFYRHESQ
ncbi:MAG: glycosyltransferase [Bacteroidales bacterium]|nr:glycosyltransferase [Bacteroidales bacterium]